MPSGFGAFKTDKEIDLLTKVDASAAKSKTTNYPNVIMPYYEDNEWDKINQREVDQKISACRVIEKFNKNSERILNFTANKSKQTGNPSTQNKELTFKLMDRNDRLMQERKRPQEEQFQES